MGRVVLLPVEQSKGSGNSLETREIFSFLALRPARTTAPLLASCERSRQTASPGSCLRAQHLLSYTLVSLIRLGRRTELKVARDRGLGRLIHHHLGWRGSSRLSIEV